MHVDFKRSRKREEEALEMHEVLFSIIKLYLAAPKLAIWVSVVDRSGSRLIFVKSESGMPNLEDNREVLLGITSCLLTPQFELKELAAEALLALHQPSYIRLWGPINESIQSFWSIGSQVAAVIAKQLLELHSKDESAIRYHINLLHQVLVRRNRFLRIHLVCMTAPHPTNYYF